MMYYCVVTRIGAALEAASKADGDPVVLSEMAVGDGGGAQVTPSAEMQSLIHERWRGFLNDLYVDPDNPDTWIAVAVIPENVGGFTLREIGLFTDDGDLYAVGNLAETVKPVLADGSAKTITLRMPITISSDANVKLLIDPSKALATHEFVDRQLAAHDESAQAHSKIFATLLDSNSAAITVTTLSANLAVNADVVVPSYRVGSGKLLLFLNELYCRQGTTNADQYQEVGLPDENSTVIRFHDVLESGWTITAISLP